MATDVSPPGARATIAELIRPATMTVEPRAHLAGAAYLMKRGGDNALVVITNDADRRPLAVITDSDISQAVADGRNLEETRIEDLSDGPPATVEPGTSVQDAAETMLATRMHHLPVVDGGRLVGIVDIAAVCRALLGRPAPAP